MNKRDEILSFIQHWNQRSGISLSCIAQWLGLQRGRYYEWSKRSGSPNEHNGRIPKSHWLLESEKQAIVDFAKDHLQAGYRRMSYLMLDADVVAVSPSSVYRVLSEAGMIQKWTRRSSKGSGFEHPTTPHEHWHIDFSYIRIKEVFFFLCIVLDGYSRAVLSWDLKPSMTEVDAEITLQKAREAYPGQKPRIISDNGGQFVFGDFKAFINICDMTHVTTSPYYPQSNGKLERFNRTIKGEGIRPNCPLDQEDAQRIIANYIEDYNQVRLHSAIGYVPPLLRLTGQDAALQQDRKTKLKTAAQRRKASFQEEQTALSQENPFSSQEEDDKTLAVI